MNFLEGTCERITSHLRSLSHQDVVLTVFRYFKSRIIDHIILELRRVFTSTGTYFIVCITSPAIYSLHYVISKSIRWMSGESRAFFNIFCSRLHCCWSTSFDITDLFGCVYVFPRTQRIHVGENVEIFWFIYFPENFIIRCRFEN